MHPTSYDKIKGTLILSSPPIGPIIDTMDALMTRKIKRIDSNIYLKVAFRIVSILKGVVKHVENNRGETKFGISSWVATIG